MLSAALSFLLFEKRHNMHTYYIHTEYVLHIHTPHIVTCLLTLCGTGHGTTAAGSFNLLFPFKTTKVQHSLLFGHLHVYWHLLRIYLLFRSSSSSEESREEGRLTLLLLCSTATACERKYEYAQTFGRCIRRRRRGEGP